MSGNTTHYGLIKPVVGGSDNEWGGNLNDDLDEIDKLLGGDRPIDGIDIDSGTIDGGAIEGIIGDGANDVEIHANTTISGKVKRLEGLPDPDGLITNCDVEARDLSIENSVTENQVNLNGNNVTVNPSQGTLQYLTNIDAAGQTVNINMQPGQCVTFVGFWGDANNPASINWVATSGTIKWIGGGSPNFNVGDNVVQFWCMNLAGGAKVICGAYAGVVS